MTPKRAGGDLLDRRAAQVAVRVGRRARGILAALAGVRAARRCGSWRSRASRAPRCEIEPSDMAPVAKRRTISLDGSTSVERRSAGRRAAARAGCAASSPARDASSIGLGEGAERRVALVAHGALQLRDRVGVPDVVLAARCGTGRGRPRRARRRSSAARVPRRGVGRDAVEPDAADARGRAGEVARDDLAGPRPTASKICGAAVALDRRDAHLREHLEQALADRLDVALLRLVDACSSPSSPAACSPAIESNARYGEIAAAP